jgi:hypothetical protein
MTYRSPVDRWRGMVKAPTAAAPTVSAASAAPSFWHRTATAVPAAISSPAPPARASPFPKRQFFSDRGSRHHRRLHIGDQQRQIAFGEMLRRRGVDQIVELMLLGFAQTSRRLQPRWLTVDAQCHQVRNGFPAALAHWFLAPL